MKRWSLSLKLTAVFILISVATIAQLYFGFSDLVETRLLKVEREKAQLIAETIEPMLGMNAYLGLKDELIQQLEQAAKNPQIVGLTVYLNGGKVWETRRTGIAQALKVTHPIIDPVDGQKIGSIELNYASNAFTAATKEMKRQILWQLGLLAVGLLFFALFARALLKPLGIIANVVQAYRPGERLQFPNLRQEPETQAPAVMGTASGSHRIELEFDKLSWVEIKQANGKVLLSQLNPAGTRQFIEGVPPFEIVIGNAANVRLKYNDAPVDLRPHFKVDVARLVLE